MANYCVSYDLVRKKDYPPLLEELRVIGAVRALESCWFVQWNGENRALYDRLHKHMDKDDRLLVTEMTRRSWIVINLQPGAAEWLKTYNV